VTAVGSETALASGYALFLVVTALGIDALARHSHVRSDRFRTAGFTYHEHLDAWECPQGERLHRRHTDHERRLAGYRAPAKACNSCALKPSCTDSELGREIVRALDPWPHSEAGRFHRGVCLVLVGLAGLIVAVAAVRRHHDADLALLLVTALPLVLAIRRLLTSFLDSPAGFPQPP
jgi:hypothetical protein